MTTMNWAEQWGLVAKVVDSMKKNQWAGETHIQKALYFLESMLRVPCSYSFILYKHGPYSFDLHDDLGAMRAYLVLDVEPRHPYGLSFGLGRLGKRSIDQAEETIAGYSGQIEFVVNKLGSMDVRTLERYATALYVKNQMGNLALSSLAKAIAGLKPHISLEDASAAVGWVSRLEEEARNQGVMPSE